MRQFQWSDLKYFLELVRTGSPVSAGRRLKADHTTVRRRIAALEDALRARLFAPRGQAYELTAEGDRLLKYAEAMEKLALRAEEEIADSDLAISGSVRVGAPDGFGAFYLAPRLAQFGAIHPELQIQLVILPRVVNLSNREADLAIGLSPPDQHRQIVRKLTNYRLRIFASEPYLNNRAPIQRMEDLAGQRFVGYIPDLLYSQDLDVLPKLDESLAASFESTSIMAQIGATLAGAGLCVLPDFVASAEPRLQPVLANSFSLTRQFYLVIHPEMINLSRVRTTIDFIVESVRQERSLFLGANQEAGSAAADLEDADAS